jgi:hypothetical protein
MTATAITPNTTPRAMPSVRSLGCVDGSLVSSDGTASFAVLVPVDSGRLTSLLVTGMVARVVGDNVGDADIDIDDDVVGDIADDVDPECTVYVDDSITTTLGQVRDATSDTVVDG